MVEYTEKIREIAKKILADGIVEMVIGFKAGTIPFMNQPCLIRQSEEVDQLIWDDNCGINLANYITNHSEKIGIVAKGCDTRNIINHIIENKANRDRLFIIGIPCKGMLDQKKIKPEFKGEVTEVINLNESIMVKNGQSEAIFKKAEILQNNCETCQQRNPVIYDELVGELVAELKISDQYQDVNEVEAMSPDERWDYFEKLLKNCDRCYACRKACPLCFCPTCFVDESDPQWVGKGESAIDVRAFHFLRAFHMAGRCTDCGACERVCPQGIKMRILTKKMEKDCSNLWGWKSGMTIEERPPLDTFNVKDPDDFIK